MIFTVSPDHPQQRLDIFLAACLENVSRSTIQRWIRSGAVRINGQTERASYLVKEHDEIAVTPPPPEPLELLPEDLPLQIVYEDDWLVVVDKPAGMVVHPGAGNRAGTLANALLHHFQEVSRRETIRPGIVHRLDKDTSGLIVVAKNEQVHEFLAGQFKRREVDKQYLALVSGRLPRKSGTIDVPLGRDPRARTRISTRSRRGRPALTEYQVIRHFSRFTYVRVILHTGRTHQIRVHFQHLGHPVVGDKTYGRAKASALLGRQFVHATFLAFTHPTTGKRAQFQSPLPGDLADFLARLE
ncbi:MAG: RluA family pseudouridine synthase [Acidobacteriota bacterium]